MNDSKDEKKLLEQLIIAILNKFLGKDFVIVRSATYDAIENKIDIVLLERKTGNIVSVFVEVESGNRGIFLQEITNKVLERNLKGGGKLKYGIVVKGAKISKGQQESIPIFYLALSKEVIEEGLKEIIPSLEESSDYEKKLFKYFISSLNSQVSLLKLESSSSFNRLNPELEEKILHFGERLDNLWHNQ